MDTSVKRFLDKVEKTETCWTWLASKARKGYGRFYPASNILVLAHRFSYQLHKGPIPEGKLVLHTCDNPSCVNPEHLWLGTNQDNMTDKKKKGRGHALRGSENLNSKLTEDQIKEIRTLNELGISQRELGRQFDVYWLTIFNIVHRKTWKHI